MGWKISASPELQIVAMGGGLKYLVHGFVTENGQKISKSLGNAIDPLDLIAKYRRSGKPKEAIDRMAQKSANCRLLAGTFFAGNQQEN